MKYLKAYAEENNEIIDYIINKYNFSSKLANYVYHLGYDTKSKVDDYLNPKNSTFHDPFLFPNMKEVVERINNAILGKESILIYGDYDVDGIGATYILLKYLEERGIKANYFLPSRHLDGYGLTINSIDKIIERFNPSLVITVDCGITCINEVEYIKSKGIDIIITDHHEPLETLPNCLVLDCKIPNQEYPFKCLCGAGMALKLVYALSDFETAKKYFTVCAISTIADIVELQDENRYIVKEGLENYDKNCPVGLAYLIKQSKIFGTPTAKDISFKVAPKINATGRMGDASVALELYLATDKKLIQEIHKKVLSMNEERQNLCTVIKDEILNAVKQESAQNKPIIVLKNKHWETGILGIVCSKVVEIEHKPVILLGYDERIDAYAGSARSFANFDLHSAISKNSKYLLTFGGHKYACGLTIKEENFRDFEDSLYETVSNTEISSEEIKYYDIELSSNEISFTFAKNLTLLEPFGVGNSEPIFKTKTHSITTSPMNNHFEHLILEIGNTSALYFGNSKSIYTLSLPVNKEIYFNLNLDYFMHKPIIKLIMKEYHCEEFKPFNEAICEGAKLRTALLKENVTAKYSLISSFIEEETDNILYISFAKNVNLQDLDEVNYINCSAIGRKTLLVSPILYDNLEHFNKIVFLEDLENTNIISFLNNKYPNTDIYANINEKSNFKVQIKTALILQVFNELKNINESIFDCIYLFKKYFSKLNISFYNLIICLHLLEAMQCIRFYATEYKLDVLCDDLDIQKLKYIAQSIGLELVVE